ncbi:hypothetical protein GCM10010276_86430 [Streptomyces longisporus]|uniref:Uncharacterized protein n=1 Tax=Streptomyces longisporus TaxID=1948 RepID=A0ABN3NLP2_STRLO
MGLCRELLEAQVSDARVRVDLLEACRNDTEITTEFGELFVVLFVRAFLPRQRGDRQQWVVLGLHGCTVGKVDEVDVCFVLFVSQGLRQRRRDDLPRLVVEVAGSDDQGTNSSRPVTAGSALMNSSPR